MFLILDKTIQVQIKIRQITRETVHTNAKKPRYWKNTQIWVLDDYFRVRWTNVTLRRMNFISHFFFFFLTNRNFESQDISKRIASNGIYPIYVPGRKYANARGVSPAFPSRSDHCIIIPQLAATPRNVEPITAETISEVGFNRPEGIPSRSRSGGVYTSKHIVRDTVRRI